MQGIQSIFDKVTWPQLIPSFWLRLPACMLLLVGLALFYTFINYQLYGRHLGCKKVRGQLEAACKQAGATKSLVSAEAKLLYQNSFGWHSGSMVPIFSIVGLLILYSKNVQNP